MENKANYAIVGAFVLVFILLINIFVIWVSRTSIRSQVPYDIYFTGSVTGLQVGSAVRYRGVPVGAVKEIKIDKENVEQIRVTINIEGDVPIKEDSHASIETMGITGITYVQVHGGSRSSPPLRYDGRQRPIIPSRASRFEEVFSSVPGVLNQASALIQEVRTLFSEENRKAMHETLKNIELLTQSLVSTDEKAPSLGKTLHSVANQLKGSLESLDNAARSIGVLFEGNRSNIARFLNQASQTLETFDRIGRSLENSPTRFLTNDPQQGVRVP